MKQIEKMLMKPRFCKASDLVLEVATGAMISAIGGPVVGALMVGTLVGHFLYMRKRYQHEKILAEVYNEVVFGVFEKTNARLKREGK